MLHYIELTDQEIMIIDKEFNVEDHEEFSNED